MAYPQMFSELALRDVKRVRRAGRELLRRRIHGIQKATFVVARDDGLTDEPRERIYPSLLVIWKCEVGAVAEFL
jgi:hypothetical protein